MNGVVFILPSSSGLAKEIMSSGRISGTPPTQVETTYRPAQAASRIAIPKDSVSEVFKKMDPRTRTYMIMLNAKSYRENPRPTSRTSLWRTGPRSSMRSWSRCFSLIWSNSFSFGPVPPAWIHLISKGQR